MGSRKGERRKLGGWEDEKVSRAQSAWGIGHRAEGRRGKSECGSRNAEG